MKRWWACAVSSSFGVWVAACGPTAPVATAADVAECCDCLAGAEPFEGAGPCVAPDDVAEGECGDVADEIIEVAFAECAQLCVSSCDAAVRGGYSIPGAAAGSRGQLFVRMADTSEGFFRTGSWSDMLTVCEGEGGTLASFDDDDDSFTVKNAEMGGWIGLNDRESENLWEWTDRTTWNPLLVDDWGGGEPNDNGGEDCVEINSDGWNDLNCDDALPAICEL